MMFFVYLAVLCSSMILAIPHKGEVSLSKEASGQRSLKSAAHNTWLRATPPTVDRRWNIDMADHLHIAEQWIIEDHKGKVALKSPFSFDYYLYARHDGSVNLAMNLTKSMLWTPLKHADGSWTFKSVNGQWLSADKDGSVYTVTEDIDSWEHFWLGTWTDPSATSHQHAQKHTSLSRKTPLLTTSTPFRRSPKTQIPLLTTPKPVPATTTSQIPPITTRKQIPASTTTQIPLMTTSTTAKPPTTSTQIADSDDAIEDEEPKQICIAFTLSFVLAILIVVVLILAAFLYSILRRRK